MKRKLLTALFVLTLAVMTTGGEIRRVNCERTQAIQTLLCKGEGCPLICKGEGCPLVCIGRDCPGER